MVDKRTLEKVKKNQRNLTVNLGTFLGILIPAMKNAKVKRDC